MNFVLVENNDLIKKTTKKDPQLGCKNFHELLKNSNEIQEWTRQERVNNYVEYFGSADMSMIVDPEVLNRLTEKGVKSIEDIEVGEKDICWFCVQSKTIKKTKAGKSFLVIEASSVSGKSFRVNVWGWNETKNLDLYSVCLAEVERNDFGHSTTSWKLKIIGGE